jgi:hypothetical protein
MNVKLHNPPQALLTKLESAKLNYSTAKTLFHFVWLNGGDCCGVFGDGDNGGYEWFAFIRGSFKHTDCGYGCTEAALKDVLNHFVE